MKNGNELPTSLKRRFKIQTLLAAADGLSPRLICFDVISVENIFAGAVLKSILLPPPAKMIREIGKLLEEMASLGGVGSTIPSRIREW